MRAGDGAGQLLASGLFFQQIYIAEMKGAGANNPQNACEGKMMGLCRCRNPVLWYLLGST